MSEMSESIPEMSSLTPNDFFNRLAERVSGDNARLLLNSALVRTGLYDSESHSPLAKSAVKSLCLELIRTGGPAFQVGQALYREVH
jgi:hypothetical protein